MTFDDTFWTLVVAQSWQLVVCALVAAGLSWAVGFRRAHLAHALWMLVLLKALTPPIVASPTSAFSWLQGPQVNVETTQASTVPTLPSATAIVAMNAQGKQPRPASAGTDRPTRTLRGSLAKWTALFWSTGSALLLSWIVLAQVVWWRRLRRSSLPVPSALQAQLEDIAFQLGMPAAPRLIVSTLNLGPVAGGIVRPTVVLPAQLQGRTPCALEPLLAHELVHLRRLDPLWSLIQWAAVSLLWWHPVVWWASRSASRYREWCCDAEVIGALSCPPATYAESLLDLLRKETMRRPLPVPLTLPITCVTRRRIEHIMQAAPFSSRPSRRHWLVAIGLAFLLLPGGRFARNAISQQADRQPVSVAETDRLTNAKDAQALQNFDRDYGLQPGQTIKRIAPPFPDSRMAFYRIRTAKQAAAMPQGPAAMIFQWENGKAKLTNMMFDDAIRGETLRTLLPHLCRTGPERLQGDDRLLDQRLPGDFALDAAAPREIMIPELNRMLRLIKPHPVLVKLEETKADVYVARGPFQLSKAAKDRRFVLIEGAAVGTASSVEDAVKHAKFSPRGDIDGFLNWLRKSTKVPIINEVKPPPQHRIRYQSIIHDGVRGDPSFNPQRILNGVSEQTGLTFTNERRSIWMLKLEEVK